MSTIRQQIIDAIDTRLKSIRQENGYSTDIGVNVFPWRTTTLLESELPAIIYKDGESQKFDETVGEIIREILVEISVTVAAGTSAPDDLRKALADIYKAIAVDVTWGGLAQDTQDTVRGMFYVNKTWNQPFTMPESDSMQIPDRGTASFTISILYSANRWEM